MMTASTVNTAVRTMIAFSTGPRATIPKISLIGPVSGAVFFTFRLIQITSAAMTAQVANTANKPRFATSIVVNRTRHPRIAAVAGATVKHGIIAVVRSRLRRPATAGLTADPRLPMGRDRRLAHDVVDGTVARYENTGQPSP